MLLLLLSINIALTLSLNDFEYVSQHSLIDLKYHYISYLDKYGFAISSNQNSNLILQPFQNIVYFFLCKDRNKVYDPENNCDRINNLEANTDNFLGTYSQYDSLIFLFNTSELQMKYFFDKSPYTVNIDIDSDYKCFDFFSGYTNLLFYLDTKLNYSRTVNVQFITNNTGSEYNSSFYIVNRNSMKTVLYINNLSFSESYILPYYNKYSLYYSTPNLENIHSMLCLSFSDFLNHSVTNNTKVIPLISPGYYYFLSELEKEWNISSEYYPTTFYFYLESSKIINCSCEIHTNKSKDSKGCGAKKDDNVDNLYTIKIYSRNNSYILLKLFLEPEMIDENCHFGYKVLFNKKVEEYNPVEHFIEVLDDMITFVVFIFTIILIFAGVITFYPLIQKKCCKCKKKE